MNESKLIYVGHVDAMKDRFLPICASKQVAFAYCFPRDIARCGGKASGFVPSFIAEGAQNIRPCYRNALMEYENLPGVSRTLVDYLGGGVGRPDSRIVATPKGTEIRVCLPQQSSLKHTRPWKCENYATRQLV